MKILIAEDDAISRKLLEANLKKWGHEIESTSDGLEAWQILQREDSPRMAILDWMMPEIDGVELCKRVRGLEKKSYTYIILLTAKRHLDDIVKGLSLGADDYVTKPFNSLELKSRVKSGERIINLELKLADKIADLQDALDHVKQLQGLLPICMFCKKIRDDSNTWNNLEEYIEEHSGAMFSHSLCRECRDKHYPELAEKS